MTLVSDRPAVLRPRPLEALVDLSEPLDDASAEDRRPAWMTRTEPCACGGTIVAPDMPAMIAAAVGAHQWTTLHEIWRGRQGWIRS
jgi:hypothetical protein